MHTLSSLSLSLFPPTCRLRTAQEELDKVMAQLKEKRDKLETIEAKVGL